MRTMVKLVLVVILAFSFGKCLLHSQSVAVSDDFLAPFYNPAALSVDNASGIGFMGHFEKQGDSNSVDDFHIIYNEDNLGFVYSKINKKDNYQLSLAQKIFLSNYLGADIKWSGKHIDKAEYGVSLLSRPHNSLSFGAYLHDVLEQNSDRGYTIGLGVKPLWNTTNRLILSAEADYTKDEDGKDYDINRKVVGIHTNLYKGLFVGGNYELESKTIGLNISLTNKQSIIGSLVDLDDDKKIARGAYYISHLTKDYPISPFAKEKGKMYSMKLTKQVVEEKEQVEFGLFAFIREQQTFEGLIKKIEGLKDDKRISGIILKNPRLVTNYANIERLGRVFEDFKKEDKQIVVYSNDYGNLHYAFYASIADEIYLNPNGGVGLQGFSAQVPYINEMLDKVGIDIYDLKSHEHKTAMNMFTESEMSEYEKEAYEMLLSVYYEEMVDMIMRGRGEKLTQSPREIINEGPHLSAQKAIDLGLVDRLVYEEEFDKLIEKRYGKKYVTDKYPNEEISTHWAEQSKKKIALIYAVGNIGMGKSRPGIYIGSESLSKQIRKAREDSSVKGIIMRVDSGGGSPFASDVIAREIKLCREAKKPVIVSMGNAAASGGYYISAYADKIVAEKTTITGSIGVTGMIPNFHRLFKKLHVNWGVVKKGDNSDLLSPFRPLESWEIELMKDYTKTTYDEFVKVVADGRGMDISSVNEVAQGRVWSGYDAKNMGLIDEFGGLDKAVELMKEMTGFNKISLVDYSYKYDKISLPMKSDMILKINILEELPLFSEEVKYFIDYVESFQEENVQYRTRPVEIKGMK